jgi:rhamnosyltransferase
MKISVIIPTYNAQKYTSKLFERVKEQTIDFELIVIDSSSTDDTVKIAKKYTNNIIVIPQKEFDHGGTRTRAAKISTGDIIVFLTQDALLVDNNSIELLVEVFKYASVGAAYGRQIPYENSSLFGSHLREFNYGKKSYIRTYEDIDKYGIKTAFLSDSFAAYRRSALESIGWFKDGLILGEDSYAGAKMILNDYALAYVADAKVYHSHSYTIMQEFKRYFDIGVFHKKESWILKEFGKAEGEGGKYVKSEFTYLLSKKAYLKIPEFFLRNGMKYLGYKLGYYYNKLPKGFLQNLSMHPSWWNK